MIYKILYLSRTTNLGGAEISLLDLLINIDKSIYLPVVVLPDKKGLFYKELVDNGIKVVVLRIPFLQNTLNPFLLLWFFLNIIFFNFFFLYYIAKENIKIIVCNSFQDAFFIVFATKILRKRVLIYIKNILDKNWKKYIRAKICDLFSSKVIAISRKNSEDFTKYSKSKDKITIIYDGIDINKLRKNIKNKRIYDSYLNDGKDSFKIINIGNLSLLKGQKLLLESLTTEKLKNINLKVFLIGDAYFKRDKKHKKELVEYIKKNNLENKVFMLGFKKNIGDFIYSSDLLVHCPVIEEGLGLVILEAFSLGKIAIGTNIGGIPEMIRDGYNGFLCLPDKESLSEKISFVLENKDNLAFIIKNARKTLEEEFNLETKIKKTEEIYKNMLFS